MKNYTWAVAVGALVLCGTAWGDDPGKKDEPKLLTNIGMTAELGGGVGGFLDSRATNITQPQGLWTARLMVGSRSHIAGEAAYVGAAQSLTALGVDKSSYLMSNGVEGAVRLNLFTGMWQPYALAGVGWLHYTVQNTTVNTSDVSNQSDVAEFPLGVGIAFRYQGFVADLRVSYHPAATANLIPNVNLSTWNAGGRIGFEF